MAHQRSDELSGAWLKVDRAKEHIDNLGPEIRSFLDTEPYVIVREDDPQTGDEIFKVKIRAEPPKQWGVILGDVLHNLRSALDLLAWQLILANGGTPDKRTAFPVSDTAEAFRSGGLGKIEGISPRSRELLKAVKPYKGGCEPLWWLHQLNIEDKHHLLVPVGTAYRHFEMTFKIPVPWQDEPVVAPPIAIRTADRLFPLKDGEQVFGVSAQARESQAHTDYRFVFEVAFGKAGVLEGEPIFPTLTQIAEVVERILRVFERRIFA